MTDPIARLNAALEGRYAIERELGEGGMATVYLVFGGNYEHTESLGTSWNGGDESACSAGRVADGR
jgi:hypothetical protein